MIYVGLGLAAFLTSIITICISEYNKALKIIEEKPMNKIEELEQIIKDAQSKIEEIKEQDNNEDWKVKKTYFVDQMLKATNTYGDGQSIIVNFSEMKDFNDFEKKEHAELWARKINANLKLWHIAQKLNDGWKPDWRRAPGSRVAKYWFLNIEIELEVVFDHARYRDVAFFKTKELAEKAKRLMGDMLKDLYLEIY